MQHIRARKSWTVQGPDGRLIRPADLGQMDMFGIVSDTEGAFDLT